MILSIESLSNWFEIKDRVYTVIYLVKKKTSYLNHYGEDHTLMSSVKESFETSLGQHTCELYKTNIFLAYGLCDK